MNLTRRTSLALGVAFAVPAFAAPAHAQAGDPRMADRALGNPDAPMTVQEYFSLTCTHCAAFAREIFPQIRTQLIDTGKVRYIYRDFPLDQIALTAAMIARALPPERYEPFVNALLASQDRWAFIRNGSPADEIAKRAALAGMPRAVFDATVADDGLKNAILAEQAAGETRYKVDSTPTFVFNGKPKPGELSFEAFSRMAAAV